MSKEIEIGLDERTQKINLHNSTTTTNDLIDVIENKEIKELLSKGLEILSEGFGNHFDGVNEYSTLSKKNLKYRNTTLFGSGGLDITDLDILFVEKQIKKKLNVFQLIQDLLVRNKELFHPVEYKMRENQLLEYFNKLKRIQLSIPNEIYKGEYVGTIKSSNIEADNRSLEHYNSEVFGPRVSDQKDLYTIIIRDMHRLLSLRSDVLSQDDQHTYSSFLSALQEDFDVNLDDLGAIESMPVNILDKYKISGKTKMKVIKTILEIEKSKNARNGFKGLHDWRVAEKEGMGGLNVNQGEETISEGIDKVRNLGTFGGNIGHEVSHMISGANENLLDTKGSKHANYFIWEEGGCKCREDITTGKITTIDDMDKWLKHSGFGISYLFINEQIGGSESINLMRIFKDLYDNKKGKNTKEQMIKERLPRYKRGFALDSKMAISKDQVYDKGKVMIGYLAKESNNIGEFIEKLDLLDEGKKSLEDASIHRILRNKSADSQPLAKDHFVSRYVLLRLEAAERGEDEILIQPGTFDEYLLQRWDFDENELMLLDELIQEIKNEIMI